MRQYRVAAGAAAGKRVGPVLSASTRRLFVCLARRLDDVFEPEAFPDGAGASGPENLPGPRRYRFHDEQKPAYPLRVNKRMCIRAGR